MSKIKEGLLIKLVCIKETDIFSVDVGKIYEGRHYIKTYTPPEKHINRLKKAEYIELVTERWIVYIDEYIIYLPIENFTPLSEYRENRINEILND